MGKGFTISRVGHVGIHVTDMDRSLAWYRDILGLTLTGRWPAGGGEMAFMRFDEEHHNIVLFTHPTKVTPENRNAGYNALQHIALEMDSRYEWLKALHDLRHKGVKIERGPLSHGPEGRLLPEVGRRMWWRAGSLQQNLGRNCWSLVRSRADVPSLTLLASLACPDRRLERLKVLRDNFVQNVQPHARDAMAGCAVGHSKVKGMLPQWQLP